MEVMLYFEVRIYFLLCTLDVKKAVVCIGLSARFLREIAKDGWNRDLLVCMLFVRIIIHI